MKNKTILVANNHLKNLGGSETFTYTLIKELLEKGFDVEFFTFQEGVVSEKIKNDLGVQFMSKKSYDLILANHNTCVRYLNCRGKIIQTCHGIFPKLEQPSKYADGYVSISNEVHLSLKEKGYPSAVIVNGIDCERFKDSNPINSQLNAVLSLCQSEEANTMISSACSAVGVNFMSLNKYKNAIWDVQEVINKADLVVGLGRSAYEAMACGRAVVVFDNRSYFKSYSDGYVTSDLLKNSILNNCSGRFYKKEFSVEDLVLSFKQYKKSDGEFLRNFALKNLNISIQVSAYLEYAASLEVLDKNNMHTFVSLVQWSKHLYKTNKRKIKNRVKLFFKK